MLELAVFAVVVVDMPAEVDVLGFGLYSFSGSMFPGCLLSAVEPLLKNDRYL